MIRFKISPTIPLAALLVGTLMANAAPLGGRAPQAAAAAATPAYLTPYAQPVSLSVGWPSLVGATNLPKDATQQNNLYVKYIEKKLNVQFNWAFTVPPGDPYTQKVGLSLASSSWHGAGAD